MPPRPAGAVEPHNTVRSDGWPSQQCRHCLPCQHLPSSPSSLPQLPLALRPYAAPVKWALRVKLLTPLLLVAATLLLFSLANMIAADNPPHARRRKDGGGGASGTGTTARPPPSASVSGTTIAPPIRPPVSVVPLSTSIPALSLSSDPITLPPPALSNSSHVTLLASLPHKTSYGPAAVDMLQAALGALGAAGICGNTTAANCTLTGAASLKGPCTPCNRNLTTPFELCRGLVDLNCRPRIRNDIPDWRLDDVERRARIGQHQGQSPRDTTPDPLAWRERPNIVRPVRPGWEDTPGNPVLLQRPAFTDRIVPEPRINSPPAGFPRVNNWTHVSNKIEEAGDINEANLARADMHHERIASMLDQAEDLEDDMAAMATQPPADGDDGNGTDGTRRLTWLESIDVESADHDILLFPSHSPSPLPSTPAHTVPVTVAAPPPPTPTPTNSTAHVAPANDVHPSSRPPATRRQGSLRGAGIGANHPPKAESGDEGQGQSEREGEGESVERVWGYPWLRWLGIRTGCEVMDLRCRPVPGSELNMFRKRAYQYKQRVAQSQAGRGEGSRAVKNNAIMPQFFRAFRTEKLAIGDKEDALNRNWPNIGLDDKDKDHKPSSAEKVADNIEELKNGTHKAPTLPFGPPGGRGPQPGSGGPGGADANYTFYDGVTPFYDEENNGTNGTFVPDNGSGADDEAVTGKPAPRTGGGAGPGAGVGARVSAPPREEKPVRLKRPGSPPGVNPKAGDIRLVQNPSSGRTVGVIAAVPRAGRFRDRNT
ncbi:unnamed protein product [Vitrella brassicaformis CCMP3155]|uniref:Uncharacterized protein n=2 Tax=Vitrella brassicaformis TaxID=1169539 RepID=A0A0G4FYE9_VITBC|nr:unnamed protein product [Vitrella brassicaformis CCMP3155]|eukprot:CEM20203.1 unnamed protein product [Vitrella brassicaformis CCMP3155]